MDSNVPWEYCNVGPPEESCEEELPLTTGAVMTTPQLINPLKTSPENTRTVVYGKCMLKQNHIVLNKLFNWSIGKF